jgi:hypothetical protein
MPSHPNNLASIGRNVILHLARPSVGVAFAAIVALLPLSGCEQSGTTKATDAPGTTSPESVSRPASTPFFGPNLTSNLRIGAGQRFIFAGGAEDRAYTASVENNGTVPITVMRGAPGNPAQAANITTLAPGEKAVQKFALGEAAIFENTSAAEATLIVKVWGDTNVGMRYEALRAMEAAEKGGK